MTTPRTRRSDCEWCQGTGLVKNESIYCCESCSPIVPCVHCIPDAEFDLIEEARQVANTPVKETGDANPRT